MVYVPYFSTTFSVYFAVLTFYHYSYDVMFKIPINTYKIKFPLFKNYQINEVKYYSYS